MTEGVGEGVSQESVIGTEEAMERCDRVPAVVPRGRPQIWRRVPDRGSESGPVTGPWASAEPTGWR